ncbi:MAG: TonB-dependent receptor [Spongiibacteraceae bacterium]|nr:TonB-dependent receptor [Spongiibacteraceae bacterium]
MAKKRSFSVVLIALVLLTATATFAQGDGGASVGMLEEVVVTATRRETLLSKTPITMTALSADFMRRSGVTDARKLTEVVPNLRLTENGDAVRISIRGVTSTDTTEKGDPSAAFMLDGIYIARPSDMLGGFYDLERVEVLRGPQGTLYGRNTTAGVINVISARPKPEFEGSVDATLGNLGTENFTAMINVPVGETLGIRAAINYEQKDNILTKGVSSRVDLDPYRDNLAARLSLGGEIEALTFVVIADAFSSKGAMANAVPITHFYPDTFVPTVDPRHDAGNTDDSLTLPFAEVGPSYRDNDRWGLMTQASYDLSDSVFVTYLGSYRESDRRDERNLLVTFGPSSMANPAFFVGDFEQNSHELRLAFGEGQSLQGQMGIYYFKEETHLEFNIGAPLSQIVGGANTLGFAFPQGPVVSESQAFFSQLTYAISAKLNVIAGVRYTDDEKSREGATVIDVQDPVSGDISRTVLNENLADKNWEKTTGKLGVDYELSELGLLYASVSTGYKAGGFNDGCITGEGLGCVLTEDALFYEPEELTSYEAGFKFTLADNTLRINGAVFHYIYENIQLSQLVTEPTPATLIRNAGEAKVNGIELDGVWQPYGNGTVDFGVTWTEAVYDKFDPDPVNFPSLSWKDKHLDHAPEAVLRLAYTHTFVLSAGGSIDVSVSTLYSSSYYMQDLNNLSQFEQPSYQKTDMTVTYFSVDDEWYLQSFAKTLEDEVTLAGAASGAFGSATPEDPRSFGIRTGLKF